MKINKIKKTGEVSHTYDIEVEDTHNYYLKCGDVDLVSHNSSSIQGSTNGMEPIRSLITYKSSRTATLPVLAPNLAKWKSRYVRAFDMPNNDGMIKIMAAINKWVDMSSSFNTYSPKGEISMKTVAKDVLTATKYGAKTFYYHNTDDEDKHEIFESGCSGGSCTL